jgi:hypothetical protein
MYGKALLTLSALMQILGPFLADFNHTHVKNPRWPPHAKFHNGQTMSMGLALGLASLYYTYRRGPSTSAAAKPDDYFTAALFGCLYWITGLSGILYPGSLAVDPEFGEGFPQVWLFVPLFVASWAGAWLEGGWNGSLGGKGKIA